MSGAEKKEYIIINNAYENNLKHIDVRIAAESFTCITGVSGCGKSSLIYDTLYAESNRNFLESMATNSFGKKIMDKPKVGSIENLRPALCVSQNNYNNNPRSTVGTLTDISHYLRTLFSLIINFNEGTHYIDSFFSSNNPTSCCPHCSGLGEEYDIDESAVIPDKKKTLNKGGIQYYSGSATSLEHKTLLAICENFNIDPETKIEQLTKKQLNDLLYRTDELTFSVKYKKQKGSYKTKIVRSKGALVELREKLVDIDTPSTKISIAKYLFKKTCTQCHGTKLKSEVLEKKICGKNIAETEHLQLTDLPIWLDEVLKAYKKSAIQSQVEQLLSYIRRKAKSIVRLNVGYLSADRSVTTLSGGEIQRIRIANQLNCPLKGIIYILDEPCKGLHIRNIDDIIKATDALVEKGNTVIAIEHNPYYIAKSDCVIELGPDGGVKGGNLLYCGVPNSKVEKPVFSKKIKTNTNFVILNDITFHNIKSQNVKFPLNSITCISGISGSGKSSLVSVIESCVINKRNINCTSSENLLDFKSVQRVNQQPIGKNPRSTIASYLEVFDELRNLYACASQKRFSASDFSMNVKGERCECCQGNGVLKIELNYLPESYITCPECNGQRFHSDILSVKLHNRNIHETLSAPVSDIVEDFNENESIYRKLQCLIEIGLGYLSLGQMSMHLSGGEAQRIKLVKVLGSKPLKNTLYILDEPTAGLSKSDINKLTQLIYKVQKLGSTILIVEHNISFIANVADYLIDFGKEAGEKGGIIEAQGLPKDVYNDKKSSWNK